MKDKPDQLNTTSVAITPTHRSAKVIAQSSIYMHPIRWES